MLRVLHPELTLLSNGWFTGMFNTYRTEVNNCLKQYRHNSAAQYWTYTSSSGAFTSPAMKPGTYTMVYYQGEYAVASSSVTVTAGSTTSKSISGSVKTGKTVFKIGDWDGT
jgi:hypothetical protein